MRVFSFINFNNTIFTHIKQHLARLPQNVIEYIVFCVIYLLELGIIAPFYKES